MNEDFYQLLKKDVELRFGAAITSGVQCTKLAKEVVVETHRHISGSTIKRFFGLIKSDHNPSKYTIETFAKYLGFDTWQHYRTYYKQSALPESGDETWSFLRKKCEQITEQSLISLKLRSGYNPQKAIFRAFAKEKFEAFIQSAKTATLFTAPSGYGKSITFIQFVEQYFKGANAKFPNDIVLLIDGGIFFNLYAQHPNEQILNQFLDFKIEATQERYLRKKPEERKGRMIIMIDNVDEIFFEKEKYHVLLENLMRILMAYNTKHYKMIFSCRPENAGMFSHFVSKNPTLKSCWFGVEFKKAVLAGEINIPLLSDAEMEELNMLQPGAGLKSHANDKRLTELIRTPVFFSLFADASRQNANVNEIHVIKKYFSNRLFSPPYYEEKLSLIDRFVEICDKGNDGDSVKKEKLLKQANYRLAYQELIAWGIFYEFLAPDGLFANNVFVKFRQKILFEYVILEKWLHEREVNFQLFSDLVTFYGKNSSLQCGILELFIKNLSHQDNLGLVKQIQTEIQSNSTNSLQSNADCIDSVLSVVKNELQEAK